MEVWSGGESGDWQRSWGTGSLGGSLPGSSQYASALWRRCKDALALCGEAPPALARALAPLPPRTGPKGATRAERLGDAPGGAIVEQKSPYLHDRLEAYRASVEFYRVVKAIRGQLPRGMGTLADQLFRATQSICLNIAEGAAARSRDVKRRHWDIARGSQAESAAALELIQIEDAAPAELVEKARYWLRITTLCTLGLLR